VAKLAESRNLLCAKGAGGRVTSLGRRAHTTLRSACCAKRVMPSATTELNPKTGSDLRKQVRTRRIVTPRLTGLVSLLRSRNALRHKWNRDAEMRRGTGRNERPHDVKYMPPNCPKCGTDLVKNPRGGRPTRWCSEGCKRSGESEMARLESLLRLFTEGKYVDVINGRFDELRAEAIADMQARYDHLADVPRTVRET
jgi:hypothetical protein